jgi:hypothetical protein
MKNWWPKLWEMTGQMSINKELRKRKFGWIGHTLRKDDSEPCKVALHWNPEGKEEGVGQEIQDDEMHLTNVGSVAGVILGLSPGAEKVGEYL